MLRFRNLLREPFIEQSQEHCASIAIAFLLLGAHHIFGHKHLTRLKGGIGTLSDYDEWSRITDVTQSAAAKTTTRPETVECVTAEEHRRALALMEQNASKNGAVLNHCTQATLVQESCASGRMTYLASSLNIPAGTCRRPFRTAEEAHGASFDGDILYVAPGAYTGGVVFTKEILVLSPGGAVLGD